MQWVWKRLRGLNIQPVKFLEAIDLGLEKLDRALTAPDPVYPLASVANVYTPDMTRAIYRVVEISRTTGVAFTVANPIAAQPGAILTVELFNNSGGALGAVTWGSAYVFLTVPAYPAATGRSAFTFYVSSIGTLIQFASQPDVSAAAGGGEANTASNVGSAGTGIFDAKVAVDLQFRKLNALSTRLSLALDAANKKIDFDVVEANLALGNIGGSLVIGQVPNDLITVAKIENFTGPTLVGRSPAGAGDLGPIGLSAELGFSAGNLQIVAGGVTKAMMANMATARLLGRTTAAAGVPEEIAVAAELTLAALSLGIAAQGVTYAKIQNVSASPRVLGRSTAGAGVIEELTLGIGAKVSGGVLDSSSIPLSVDADQATFVNAQTNITGMSFPIAINEKWVGEWVIPVTMGTAATGVKFYFTFPASCTGEITYEGNVATLATWQALYQAVLTVPGTFFVTGIITGVVRLRTTIRNAGTAGTIQLVGITGGATTTCAVKKGGSALLRRAA